MKISKIEVRAVAPPVDRFTWSNDLPDQYSTNTIVRIFTDEGIEGVAGVWNATSFDFERYTAESIRPNSISHGTIKARREEILACNSLSDFSINSILSCPAVRQSLSPGYPALSRSVRGQIHTKSDG